jgi:EpsI family protein
VRYLISSITLGCLYAYLTYRSMPRRVLFIALSVVVPIIANGLRAYMIVMIGHLSGMALATGVDHLIYGWLFFGLVMFIMFWIGSYWREDTDVPQPRTAQRVDERAGRGIPAMVAGVLALCALWPALAAYGEHANHNPAKVELGQLAIGWPETGAFADWTPAYMQPDVSVHRSYRHGTTPVTLTLLYYRNQDRSRSLISSVNRLAGYKDAWHETAAASRTETAGGRALVLQETVLRRPGQAILVWNWMRIGGHDTASNATGKLLQAQSKLLLRGDDGAALMLSTPFDDNPDAARAALRAFLADNLQAVDRALDTAAQKH